MAKDDADYIGELEDRIRRLETRLFDNGMFKPSFCYAVPNDETADPFWVKDPTVGFDNANYMKIGTFLHSGQLESASDDDVWFALDLVGAGVPMAIQPPRPGLYEFTAEGYITPAFAGLPMYWVIFSKLGVRWWYIESGETGPAEGRFSTSVQLPMHTNVLGQAGGNANNLWSIGHMVDSTSSGFPTALTGVGIQGHLICDLDGVPDLVP